MSKLLLIFIPLILSKGLASTKSIPPEKQASVLSKAILSTKASKTILKRLEHKLVAKDWKPYIKYLSTTLKIASEKQITIKWEF